MKSLQPAWSASPVLNGQSLFLSASFPRPERNAKFYETADPDELTQAIVAFARAVLGAGGGVVFGGHPTVSPLIMLVASEYVAKDSAPGAAKPPALIYQSKVFAGALTPATRRMERDRLGQIIWTARSRTEPPRRRRKSAPPYPRSLAIMRRQMLKREDLIGAVFLGGMEGIEDEAKMFRKLHPTRVAAYVGAPGGAARELAERELAHVRANPQAEIEWFADLAQSREYPALMQRIVLTCAAQAGLT